MATIQVDLVDAARAVRPDLHRRERPAAAPDRHPPRDLRLARAVHRHPRRALRRRVPAVARAGPGGRHPHRRPPRRGGRGARRRARARVACGSRSTARPTGCRTRSALAQEQKVPYMVVLGDREIEAADGLAADAARGEQQEAVAWDELRRPPGGGSRGPGPSSRPDADAHPAARCRARNALCYPPASAGTGAVCPRRSNATSSNERGQPSVETCASTR